MTTTQLIALLKKYEFGGATGRPREVCLDVPGYGYLSDIDFIVSGTGDGLTTELYLEVDANYIDKEAGEN